MGKKLENKPLQEAIFEIRWGNATGDVPSVGPAAFDDPNYQILLGRLFDLFQSQGYQFHESLPATAIPPQFAGHIVQHRWRVGASKWPLVQLGNGILTVNDVHDYDWDKDFFERCSSAIDAIHAKYPTDFSQVPRQLIALKYIDAYDVDLSSSNLFDILKDKFGLSLKLPTHLIGTAKPSSERPTPFVAEYAFPIDNPSGTIRFKIGLGAKVVGGEKKDAIIWEIEVQSKDSQVPTTPADGRRWLTSAHEITSAWFFALIKGKLEDEFT